MSDMEISSQQQLRETHEQKIARWEKARRERREQLIQAGIATAEQLKELDEEFGECTVNSAIHCWLKTMIARKMGYKELRSGVEYAAMYS